MTEYRHYTTLDSSCWKFWHLLSTSKNVTILIRFVSISIFYIDNLIKKSEGTFRSNICTYIASFNNLKMIYESCIIKTGFLANICYSSFTCQLTNTKRFNLQSLIYFPDSTHLIQQTYLLIGPLKYYLLIAE